ncbi:hypothetical protein [Sulfurovum sp.]|nr:hypothetical protein [Sulfurovum sp.]MDY0403467.1 hypothetical protein [Sulfurovum sp.]
MATAWAFDVHPTNLPVRHEPVEGKYRFIFTMLLQAQHEQH